MEKVWEGQRMNAAETAQLYQLPLEVLGSLAHRRRELAKAEAYDGRGNEIITYNVDRNINYTNVCNVYCKFCAFYRTAKDEDAYVITKEELDQKMNSIFFSKMQKSLVWNFLMILRLISLSINYLLL